MAGSDESRRSDMGAIAREVLADAGVAGDAGVSGTTGWSQWVRSGTDGPDIVAQRDLGTVPGAAGVN